jgi:hypothetical protein
VLASSNTYQSLRLVRLNQDDASSHEKTWCKLEHCLLLAEFLELLKTGEAQAKNADEPPAMMIAIPTAPTALDTHLTISSPYPIGARCFDF